jgi:MFS family permease
MLGAMVNFTIGSLLLVTMPAHQTYWLQTFISLLIMPGAMNLSFPAATILLSTALPKEKQGIAASLVSTMVNYSISCGLGLAGTVHRHTFHKAITKQFGADALSQQHGDLSESPAGFDQVRMESFRGPLWFAVGLSAFGVVLASAFILLKWVWGSDGELEKAAKIRPKSMMFFPKAAGPRVSSYRQSRSSAV